MGKKKSTDFTKKGIEELANDKPVVYSIENKTGKPVYVGSAKRGRVQDRVAEHLPGGPDTIRGGAKVRIQQKPSIDDARKSEARTIARTKPPQNKKGK